MLQLQQLLSGGDLRSVGNVDSVIAQIKSQEDFDELFLYLFHPDRLVVMRAADAIEKIAAEKPSYLMKHKNQIIELCYSAFRKEVRWHLALLIPRLR